MSRARSQQIVTALERVNAGEKPATVARDMGLHPSQLYQAMHAERRKVERARADTEMRRNARRYEARRATFADMTQYDAESDELIANEEDQF